MKYLFYDSDRKNHFLSEYPEETRHYYGRIFHYSYEMEVILQKDLAEFDLQELTDLFRKLQPLTLAAARTYVAIVAKYTRLENDSSHQQLKRAPLEEIIPDW